MMQNKQSGLMTTVLAVTLLLTVSPAGAQDWPNLDVTLDTDHAMTPLSELMDESSAPGPKAETPDPAQATEAPAPAKTVETATPTPAKTAESPPAAATQAGEPASTAPVDPGMNALAPADLVPEEPAVDHAPPQAVQGDKAEKSIKKVSFTPVPAIAIFPVIKNGPERAFSDLPILLSREVALDMEQKAAGSKVFHPVYTVDELRMRGLGHVYDKIMDYYLQAGRPEPYALDYVLKQLTVDGRPITRVIFVEADLDFTHPADPTGIKDRLNAWLKDDIPKESKYYVRARFQVFNSEEAEMPMVWSRTWEKAVKVNRFYNPTPSVFQDADSHNAFSRVSRMISREALITMNKVAYMDAHYDTSVTGKVADPGSTAGGNPAFPNLSDTQPPLTDEHRNTIERILRRQNTMAP